MRHPASHDLLRSLAWPVSNGRPRRLGVLQWERLLDALPAVSAQRTRVQATASVCDRHLVLKTLQSTADGQSKPGLEIRWDWVPGQPPALRHFSLEGEEQPLNEAVALNRFKGQVYRMNVAPRWAR